MKVTLSELNNNPLNVRVTNDVWRGQCGQRKGFVRFVDDVYGYRCAMKILLGYLGQGIDTPRRIINTWAPETENDVESYIKAVCNPMQSSLMPDDPIMSRRQFRELVYMMTKVERGKFGDFEKINAAWCMLKEKDLSKTQKAGKIFLEDSEFDNYMSRI